MSRLPSPDQTAAPSDAAVRLNQAVHDLRNGMNALLMNAAVLGARANDMPDALRPFIDRIATAGRKCNDELTRVLELVEEAKPKR